MEHGKKAYGEDSFQKTGDGGILQTFAHFPHEKRRQDPKSGIAIFFMFVHVFISQPSRRARFKILPVAFFGRASRGIKRLGIL